MTTVHPRWARLVGIVWLLAGVLLLATGVVVVVDQHDVLRWEFVAAVGALGIGARSWRRSVTVDLHGVADRVGRRRRRMLWSTVDRVAVGTADWWGAPVRVWRGGAADPEALRGSWGTSRAQRTELLAVLRRVVGSHGVEVVTDADQVTGRPGRTPARRSS